MITVFDPKTDMDLGTPARESQVQVTLNIDGRSISVPEGTSVMRAAALLGTTIPNCVPPTAWKPLAPAACAWLKSTACAAIPRPAPRR